MQDSDKRIVEFDRLNLLGKAVFLGGSAVRLAANLIDTVLDRAVEIVEEAEKAFKQGRDPNVEDAKILEEHEEHRRRR
jgi:hypothetical protein